MLITEAAFMKALEEREGRDNVLRLSQTTIGIAGLGGLGSNIALMLARAGVGRLVIADFDTVELSNIHRQCYPLDAVGMKKTDAIEREVARVNPWCSVVKHDIRITPEDIGIFDECQIVCEAFDRAEQKIMLIESLASEGKTVVSGNGMAGMGPANAINTKKMGGRLYICGDGESDVDSEGSLTSSRVAVCAAHQANAALRLALGMEP